MTPAGVNFCVYAKHATGIDIQFFYAPDDLTPTRVVTLDPAVHRTGEYWHVLLPGIGAGQLYGYVAHGPWAPHEGLRFDATKLLLDPYGRGVAVPAGYRRLDAGVADDMATTDEERRHRHPAVRLGGRPAAQPAVARDDRLRGAPRRD